MSPPVSMVTMAWSALLSRMIFLSVQNSYSSRTSESGWFENCTVTFSGFFSPFSPVADAVLF